MLRNNHQGHGPQSDSEEEEDEEGNYTVYECPGLASVSLVKILSLFLSKIFPD